MPEPLDALRLQRDAALFAVSEAESDLAKNTKALERVEPFARAVTQAEASYAAEPSDERWRAVLEARERNEPVAKQAALRPSIEARLRAARAEHARATKALADAEQRDAWERELVQLGASGRNDTRFAGEVADVAAALLALDGAVSKLARAVDGSMRDSRRMAELRRLLGHGGTFVPLALHLPDYMAAAYAAAERATGRATEWAFEGPALVPQLAHNQVAEPRSGSRFLHDRELMARLVEAVRERIAPPAPLALAAPESK